MSSYLTPESQSPFERGQPGADAAVVHVAPDANAHPADERRIDFEQRLQPVAVRSLEVGLDVAAHVLRQSRCAFDHGLVSIAIESDQPQKIAENRHRAPAPRLRHAPNDEPDSVGIQPAVDLAEAVQPPCGPARSFGGLHL